MPSRRYDGRARWVRHRRVRKRVKGTGARPRLSVFRSNRHIYAQIIDDERGHTLATASSGDQGVAKGSKAAVAGAVGSSLAKRAIAGGVRQVVFDRGGYKYHGRVRALAAAAREEGLEF